MPSNIRSLLWSNFNRYRLKFIATVSIVLIVVSLLTLVPVLARSRHEVSSKRTGTVVKKKQRRNRTHSIIRTKKTRVRSRRRDHSQVGTSHQPGGPKPEPAPEPKAQNVQDSSSLAHVYHLYDLGLNDRLAGRYEQATKELLEATNTYTSTKKGLTLEAMIDYELGQSAESINNYSVAADAYTRCLRIKPTLVEAAVRLASMLMKAGEPRVALSRARETVELNPSDPRAHQLLALVLEKNGLPDDAKSEREVANRLLKFATGEGEMTPPVPPASEQMPTQSPTTETQRAVETKSPTGETKSPTISPTLQTDSSTFGTKFPPVETKSPAVETKSKPTEIESSPSETKSPAAETKSPPTETKSPAAEPKARSSEFPAADPKSPAPQTK